VGQVDFWVLAGGAEPCVKFLVDFEESGGEEEKGVPTQGVARRLNAISPGPELVAASLWT